MTTTLEKGANFIWANARQLERAIFEYRFTSGSPARIIQILKTYQNEDGGFGNALEPDLRAPDSQPLFLEFGLHTLYDCGLRAPDLAARACDFLSQHADLKQGIPLIYPSARQYPLAGHMETPSVEQPTLDRLVGLVGMLKWQGVRHPWLTKAVDACMAYVTSVRCTDAHTINTAFCLLESLSKEKDVAKYFHKLAGDLETAHFFVAGAPVDTYGLTPLDFAPTPEAYCRGLFTATQIDAHLDDLQTHQEEDGGWPILWNPPSGVAHCEWRAHQTLKALVTLRAYGRI